MQVAYQLSSNELDSSFLKSVKQLFKDKNIEIVIYDEDEEDKKLGSILANSMADKTVASEKDFLKALNED
ncbi:MAG: hypothetical protein IE909_19225 [Campylobacterales bacterium]|nr:hypothetical protein [Campylobacterota bacterium]MBD3843963.1 hypothetical protein [Campylobacterales bacterium]